MKESFKRLLELQSLDLEIKKLEDEKIRIPKSLDDGQKETEFARNEVDQAKKNLTDKMVARKTIELELSTIEEEIKKHHMEINSVKTNDAYKAVQKEIEMKKEKKNEIENNILQNMQECEDLNKIIAEKNQNLQKVNLEFDVKKQELEKSLQEVNVKASELISKRNEYLPNIEKEALVLYEKVRAHRQGVGIVEVRNNICMGCHMSIPPQKSNEIMQDKGIVICENCSRILYIKED